MNKLIQEIPLTALDVSLSQMRIVHPDRVDRIQDLMHLHGQLQPIVVRPFGSGYQVIDGLKRFYAAVELMKTTLQCYVLEVDLQQAKVLVLSYNRSAQAMEVWEEAMVLADLAQHHGLNQQHLSDLTGHSRSWVSRRLSLISKLSDELINDIRMGVISSSQARALIKLPRGNQMEVAGVIVSCGFASRQSDALVQAFLSAKNREEQQQILAHPMEVLTDNILEPPYAVYDDRLSENGNELLNIIREAQSAIKYILRSLRSRQTGELQKTERCILTPEVKKLGDYIEGLIKAISDLQTTKLIHE